MCEPLETEACYWKRSDFATRLIITGPLKGLFNAARSPLTVRGERALTLSSYSPRTGPFSISLRESRFGLFGKVQVLHRHSGDAAADPAEAQDSRLQ